MPLPDPGSMAALYSKQSLFEICQRLGIPTAFSFVPQSMGDLRAAYGRFEFPVVLKAIDPDRLLARAGIRLVIARDRQELESLFARLDEPGSPNLMLQEYIQGDDDSSWSMAAYYDGRSRCRFALTGRKLRQYPIHGGVTTLGICQPCSPLLEIGQRIAEGTGYRGIAGYDFRHDARDGKYKLLDFNPRPGANFRQYVDSSGMDVVRALYLDLTGQPLPVGSPMEGRKWLVEDHDLWAMRDYRREGRIGIREWLASFRGIRELAHIALDDPRPSLRFCATTASRIAAGALRRLTGSRR
jgi:predicted ATP-grasp superfamily ATP-dependent carboligase